MISVLTNQSPPIANVRYFLERYRPNKTARVTLFPFVEGLEKVFKRVVFQGLETITTYPIQLEAFSNITLQ